VASATRSDLINITAIDNLGTNNDQSFAYSPANRLVSASGAWGSHTYAYDPAGNRLSLAHTLADSTAEMSYAYRPLSNLLSEVETNGALSRALAHRTASPR
jgi:YD repeat-containing protein